MNKMHIIPVKPLSVNEAWRGQRYRTDSYKTFVAKVLYHLKRLNPRKPPRGKKMAHYVWGFSSDNSDTDNPTKPFQDALCRFFKKGDDKDIEFIILEKDKVRKGDEYIGFCIKSKKNLIPYLEDLIARLKHEQKGS